MAVNLSAFAGAGAQFFNGNTPLAGGKIYTYLAGTTTPVTTYTDSLGTVPASNPIVLDSQGKTTDEIWVTQGSTYKFILKSATDVQLGVYDNISGINDFTTGAASSSNINFLQAGTGAVTRTVQSKLRDVVSVKDFGAVGDGITDDAAVIQTAIDSGKPVFVPAGTYYLGTPLLVQSGNVIFGENGRGASYAFETTGSYFKPATCAIQTKNYNSQYSNFTLRNIGIIGGTVQVDLGLFHEVDIVDCWFSNASVGGLVIVRGEKQRLERLRFDNNGTGTAIFGMSLGRWQDSLYSGYSDAFFAPDGPWFDRATIKDVHCQSGTGNSTFSYGIKSTNLNGTTITNFVVHGIQDAREQYVIRIFSRFRQSQIIGCAPDAFGNPSNPAPAIFEMGEITNGTFINVSPGFSGTNNAIKQFSINGGCFWGTFIGCRADGDNTTKYGFWFPEFSGQVGTMINCDGAYYHANAYFQIRNQISQVSCKFDQANNGRGCDQDQTNTSKRVTMMADSNGAATASSTWGVLFASGGGGNGLDGISVGLDQTYIYKNLSIGNNTNGRISFNDVYNTKREIVVNTANNITPEGVVTALPGSIYLFYNGSASGKLYVKESGSGNTGWVLK